jgi:serine/threonine protein kinase
VNCHKCATPLPDNSRFCSACGADVSGDSHEHAQDATLAMEEDPQLFAKLQAELGTEYILEKELGRGGMAVVYLGRDAHLNRKVAVKVLPPELTYGRKGSMIERFKREAQTAAKLDHPNIIPVYRVAPGGTLFWYVMMYLAGEALDHILEREGQLAVDRTVEIVLQVGEALDYAHQNQVVHRDVKPANVVVDKKGRVTVTDFGIAKALDADTLTASGSIIGTPYYMSPEQCKGKRVGPAADQYSLAVMTYQMLGGHLPFTGDSAVEIVHKHVADPVPPLGVLRPQLPAPVIAVVERGLAKTPEERFPTVADFAQALKATAEGLDVTLAPPSKPDLVRASKTALVSPVPGALRTAKGRWRRKRALIIGTGITVVAAVVAVALYVRQPGAPAGSKASDSSSSVPRVAVVPPVTQAPAQPAAETAAAPPVEPAVTPASNRATRHQTRPASQGASAKQAAPQPPPVVVEQAQQEPVAPPATRQPAAAQPTPPQAAPATPAVGYLSLGTQPVSTIFVNGTPKGSRLANLEVPAGAVRLRFQVQDSSGIWWAQDREITVAPGERKVLGYVRLVRP